MPSLAESQARLRAAIVEGDTAAVAPLLAGGRNPAARLAIHRRHYQASLSKALMEKFPAVTWLAGTSFVTDAARDFARQYPPTAPCIAEYGTEFPQFLAQCPGAERMPYLRWFGELEWHLGRASITVDLPPLAGNALAALPPDSLLELRLTLQPGLRYLDAPWPVDELMNLYLSDAAPDQYLLNSGAVFLEIRGARGKFALTRLDPGTFMFRREILRRQPIGIAAERAIEADAKFNVGRAFASLLVEGLAVSQQHGDEP